MKIKNLMFTILLCCSATANAQVLGWSTQLPAPIIHAPSHGIDSFLWVPCEDNKVYNLYALGINAGTTHFTLSYADKPVEVTLGRPVCCPGYAYVAYVAEGIGSGRLHAVTSDGVELWSYGPVGGPAQSASVAKDGTIYFPSGVNLHSLNPDGSLRWILPVGEEVRSKPAIGTDGTVYFAVGSYVHAINTNGTIQWSFPVHVGVGTPAIDSASGRIYIGDVIDHGVYAIWPWGAQDWFHPTTCQVWGSPTLAGNGNVMVPTDCDGLILLNRNTGAENWSHAISFITAASATAIAQDGSIHVANAQDLLVLNPNGTTRWTYTAGGFVTTPVLGYDPSGGVFFGATDGKVYAVSNGGLPLHPYSSWPQFGRNHHHDSQAEFPIITISATDPNASEAGLAVGKFTFFRSGTTNSATTVSYSISGTATAAADYVALSGTVTFAAGQLSKVVTLTPKQDMLVEGDETVVVTVTPAAGYTPGNPNAATVIIHDND